MAFFRVKLHSKEVVSAQCSTASEAVIKGARYNILICGLDPITVHEIESRLIFNALPKGMIALLMHLIPAHMGHFQPKPLRISMIVTKKTNVAGHDAQSINAIVFF